MYWGWRSMNEHNDIINPDLKIWDTRCDSARAAFDIYREGLCCALLPWTPKFKSGEPFEARLELLQLNRGNIVRVLQTSPHMNVRNRVHIARSDGECYLLSYSLSHKWSFEQDRKLTQGGPGDLVIFDSQVPTVARHDTNATHVSALGLAIPKQLLAHIPSADEQFTNLLIPSANVSAPLGNLLWLLADSMLSAPTEEMEAIYEACVCLLPVAAGIWSHRVERPGAAGGKKGLMRHIQTFVERNLSQSSLNARSVAAHFNVSDRYVQKLFAESGTTLGCYIMMRRLRCVRRELESHSCTDPIYKIADRWGFADMTTFNRAFKRLFGCAPGRIRGD